MLRPMTLLGDFITEVGRAPDKGALTTYFARMREQVRSPLSMHAALLAHLPSTTSAYQTTGMLSYAVRNTSCFLSALTQSYA